MPLDCVDLQGGILASVEMDYVETFCKQVSILHLVADRAATYVFLLQFFLNTRSYHLEHSGRTNEQP
jgi:hypothetical protein